MRKSKTPRRSRLIRKWDGTPVGEAELQSTAQPELEATLPPQPSHTQLHPELFFEMNPEDEFSDTLEH